MCKWFNVIRELVIKRFAYQLIVPEFKARHVCWSYEELLNWECKYHHMNTRAIVIYPLRVLENQADGYCELVID